MRFSTVFPSASATERYAAASRDDMRATVSQYVARVLEATMRNNPDAPRAAEAVATELSAWFVEIAPLRVDGAVVEASLGSSGSSAVTLGMLAAIAVSALKRLATS